MRADFIKRELERQKKENEKIEAGREQQLRNRLQSLGLELTNIEYHDTVYGKWITADVLNHDEYNKVEVQVVSQGRANARFQSDYLRTKATLKNGKTINIKKGATQ